MSEQENLQIIRQGYTAFGTGDVEAVLALMSDEVESVYPGPATIPYAGTYRGKEEMRRFYAALAEALDFEQFVPREFIAQHDKVVVVGHTVAVAKPTGVRLTDEWAHIFTLRDGQIVSSVFYDDTAQAAAAFTQNQMGAQAS